MVKRHDLAGNVRLEGVVGVVELGEGVDARRGLGELPEVEGEGAAEGGAGDGRAEHSRRRR